MGLIMTDAVRVENLVVDRGGREVIHALSCIVANGRITGLIGPSGSGKTTLMRSIVGIQQIESGTVSVLGKAAGNANLRQRVGYMTQAPSIYRDLSVEANIGYFASLYGKENGTVQRTIDAVGLRHHARDRAGNLSGCQFNRVSLACTLVAEPELLILDEPTIGLDPVLRSELWQFFASLADAGKTLIVSSHVMDEAGRCDAILLLRDGSLLAALTPDELRKRGGSDDLDEAFLRLIQKENLQA